MASFSQICSNYQFHPDELSELMSVMTQENLGTTFSSGTASSGTISPLEDHEVINAFNPTKFSNISDLDHFVPPEFDVTSPPMTSFSGQQQQQLGIFKAVDPTLLLQCKMGANFDQIRMGGGYYNPLSDAYELGVECYGCGFRSNSNPVSPVAGENWGTQCGKTTAVFEHNNVKVGRYTEEERRDRILRYLKKRNQRNFNKTIKYACRKTLADRRVRVRGRFARNNEPCKEEGGRMKQDEACLQENESYYHDLAQIKMDDDEEWLQEAVASLLYVPYIAG